jgi:hypothetical protein
MRRSVLKAFCSLSNSNKLLKRKIEVKEEGGPKVETPSFFIAI